MNSNQVPEEVYENSNDFYTLEETKRYSTNSGMKKTQDMLMQIALELTGIDVNIDTSNLKVLDIGCGCGFGIDYLVNNGFNKELIVGIDPSIEMLNIPKGKGYNVLEGGFEDLKKLHFEENSFDLIMSLSALQWVSANKQELELKNTIKKIGKQLYKILKNNSYCVIQFYPSTTDVVEWILSAFKRCDLTTNLFIYNEHSPKKRKYFIILQK